MEASKKKKIIVIIIFAAIVLIALYVWWRKKKQAATATDVKTIETIKPAVSIVSNKDKQTAQKPLATGLKNPFPLVPGSIGHEVKQLQAYLLAKHGLQFPSGIDGVWGDETSRNVKKGLNLGGIAESTFKNLGIDKIKV